MNEQKTATPITDRVTREVNANSLNMYAQACHQIAVEHGWWDDARNFGEMIALMHSELSEAMEEWRDGDIHIGFEGMKPVGVVVELVDTIIRILDTMHYLGADIDTILRRKMRYNEMREYRHGGKRA